MQFARKYITIAASSDFTMVVNSGAQVVRMTAGFYQFENRPDDVFDFVPDSGNAEDIKVSDTDFFFVKSATSLSDISAAINTLAENDETLASRVATIENNVSSGLPPIGAPFFQLPGRPAPAELPGWEKSSWENISESFAGDFFRAEGGLASAFGSGKQSHAIQGHSHQLYMTPDGGPQGKFDGGQPPISDLVQGSFSSGNAVSYPITLSGYGSVAVATETRPQNQTIRIWIRVS